MRVAAAAIAIGAVLAGVVLIGVVLGHDRPARADDDAGTSPASSTSAFTPVPACRAADTRSGNGVEGVGPDRIRVALTGRCGVPDDATAAAVTITVVSPDGPGFATAWPAGGALPDTSTVNFAAGEVRANGVIVPLGGDGAIDVSASVPAELIVDVTGAFVPTARTTAGRFVPIESTRAFDSRAFGFGRPLVAGETVVVAIPAGLPVDAAALAVNVTTTAPNEPGFVTLHRADDPRPEASVVNTDRSDQTRSVAAIAPVDAQGLAVHSSAGGHVVVDVTGWFTGPSAGESSDGLFVPLDPARIIDTRNREPVWPGGTVEIAPIGDVSAIALNLTMVFSDGWNFVSAHPAGTPPPATSSVNVGARGEVAANFALVAQSSGGTALTAHARTDVLGDVAGWFTGEPVPSEGVAPRNERPSVCAADASPGAIDTLLRSDDLVLGADYQRTVALPDGRTLWLFQDVLVATRHGYDLVHNAGLVQQGACFDLLHDGGFARPRSLVLPDATELYRRWFWPLGATIGGDGGVWVFMAEVRERSGSYLGRTEPTATWLTRLDPVTLRPVETRPAPDASASLYGWSVVDHGAHTYLYSHCHRQFGWDRFLPDDPDVAAHDLACAGDVRVARVPRGEPWRAPQYWDGAGWVADASRAVPIITSTDERAINPTQVAHDGTRFVGVTKEGDWWGDRIFVDVAPAAQGPWRTIAEVPVAPRCAACNTYFASFVAPPTPTALTIGVSNNAFPDGSSRRYDPRTYSPSVVVVPL